MSDTCRSFLALSRSNAFPTAPEHRGIGPRAQSLAETEGREDAVQDRVADVDTQNRTDLIEGELQIDQRGLERQLGESRGARMERLAQRVHELELAQRSDDTAFVAGCARALFGLARQVL